MATTQEKTTRKIAQGHAARVPIQPRSIATHLPVAKTPSRCGERSRRPAVNRRQHGRGDRQKMGPGITAPLSTDKAVGGR